MLSRLGSGERVRDLVYANMGESPGTARTGSGLSLLTLFVPRSRAAASTADFGGLGTTLFSRTMSGMVPNYRNGKTATYDRTEPQLAAWCMELIYSKLKDDWVDGALP